MTQRGADCPPRSAPPANLPRVTEFDDGHAIGYKVLKRGTPVRSSDGVQVGTVRACRTTRASTSSTAS